jgi:putative membrane protein
VTRQSPAIPLALLGLVLLALIWSGIGPTDRLTWFMETVPVMIGIAILVPTWRRFPLTPLIYILLAFHAVILVIGGHYTYAEVPWFNDLRDHYELSRNYFDRLGHFVQGFVPAILAREILIRNTCLKNGPWLFLYVTSFCLAFSAFYEMLEWWAAIFTETGAEAFLGTQGDEWDTQWDMFLALIGAMLGQIILGPYHNRQIAALENRAS